MMYVYEVNGAGGALMHWCMETENEGLAVQASVTLMPPGFFDVQKSMHQKMGHTFTLEAEYDEWTVWSVRIGRANFELWHDFVIQVANENVSHLGENHEKPNTNYTSPFGRN